MFFGVFLLQSLDYKGKIVHRKAPKDFGASWWFGSWKHLMWNGLSNDRLVCGFCGQGVQLAYALPHLFGAAAFVGEAAVGGFEVPVHLGGSSGEGVFDVG